jgi:hypothetical protein
MKSGGRSALSRPMRSANTSSSSSGSGATLRPRTTENEFKEEHYRRIEYVNRHFPDQKVLGWKTDRGRIYISFGPPDEIDSHPCTGAKTAKDTWRYRWIEGIGNDVMIDFEDPACTGEYRMTMDPAAFTPPPR